MAVVARLPRSPDTRRLAARPRYAQGYIATFNLPPTLERLLEWIGPDPWTAGTQLDNLLNADLGEPFEWTAPAGVGQGNVVFLHFAAKARERVGSLRRAAQKARVLTPGLDDFFEHARAQAEVYAGRIVALGELAGPAVPQEPIPGDVPPHWASRLYAPITHLHILSAPLELRAHSGVLPQPHKAITELTAAEFSALIERVCVPGSRRPYALRNVLPGRDDFAGFSADAWRAVACREGQRFANEKELCGYLVEPLLSELRDAGTSVYGQARCVPAPGARTSPRRGELPKADYVVRIGGRWTPVEVKRRLENWPGLLDQVARYVGVAAYEVRSPDGERLRLPAPLDGDVCLLVDQGGVYAVRGGTYHVSAPGAPLWTREELAGMEATRLRRRARSLLG